MWSSWADGTAFPYLVATSALSAGSDYPSVRSILHLDAPGGLINYAQDSGRAGRDGAPAGCTILLAPRWNVTWDSGSHGDFLTEDARQMTAYLHGRSCFRHHMTAYLDGPLDHRQGTACDLSPVAPPAALLGRCGFCMGAATDVASTNLTRAPPAVPSVTRHRLPLRDSRTSPDAAEAPFVRPLTFHPSDSLSIPSNDPDTDSPTSGLHHMTGPAVHIDHIDPD